MSSESTEDEYRVELPTQEAVDKQLEQRGTKLDAVIVLFVGQDGFMDYYRDGCTQREALGLIETAKYLIIEDNIGKTRGFTFN
jgi:hypothetical protein